MELGGQSFSPEAWLDTAQARPLRLAHVPEDRHAVGLVMSFPAWESAVLGYQGLPKYRRGASMNHAAMRDATRQMQERFDVRPRDENLGSAKFSGGNQQKLIIAREIRSNPDLLIVGQPTRGVDIGAIEYIHKRIIQLRDEGKAVLLVSVELDEIRSMSDRILVMFAGRVMGERGPGASERELGLLMAGVGQDAA
jgi:simple sugar transport system ATP-binding protein